MDTLPLELVMRILDDVNAHGACFGLLRQVCRTWKSVIDDHKHAKRTCSRAVVYSMSLYRWARQQRPLYMRDQFEAAMHGNVELLRHLYATNELVTSYMLYQKAAMKGRIETLAYLQSIFIPDNNRHHTVALAIHWDQIDTALWLIDHGWWEDSLRDAFVGIGLRHRIPDDNGSYIPSGQAYAHAASHGRVDVLEWLHATYPKINIPLGLPACAIKPRRYHADVVTWCLNHGCMLLKRFCKVAAQYGYLNVLKWARSQGAPWNVMTCAMAAESGHLHIVKWLRANGCPWDDATIRYAMDRGHTNVWQWALNHGCPITVCTYTACIAHGYMDVLKTLYDTHRVPIDIYNVRAVVAVGRVDVMEWIKSITGDIVDDRLVEYAVKHNHVTMLQWLVDELGFSVHIDNFGVAAQHGSLDVLRWLHKGRPYANEVKFDISMFQHACHGRNLAMVKWLHANRYYTRSTDVIAYVHKGWLEALQWMWSVDPDYATWEWESCLVNAIRRQRMAIVAWLMTGVKCPIDNVASCYGAACRMHNFHALECLFKAGYPPTQNAWTISNDMACRSVQQWLLDLNCPIPRQMRFMYDYYKTTPTFRHNCECYGGPYTAAAGRDNWSGH